MANCPRRRRSAPSAPQAAAQSASEPSVRRWPHPIIADAEASEAPADPSFYYIRCALSYQNQLLADIKSLLEQIVTELTPDGESVPVSAPDAPVKSDARPE